MKIGAKTDLEDLKIVNRVAKEYDFIEVFFSEKDFQRENSLPKVSYTVHCPHWGEGVNLSNRRKRSKIELVMDALRFGSDMKSKFAVIHPGIVPKSMSVSEAKKNLVKNLNEVQEVSKNYGIKLLLETVPNVTRLREKLYRQTISLPHEYESIISKVGCGFCLDFPHASGAASGASVSYKEMFLEFMKLKPHYFHLYDTIVETPWDEHLAFKDKLGNMDIGFCVSLIKKKDMVVFELPQPRLKNLLNAKKFFVQKGWYLEEGKVRSLC